MLRRAGESRELQKLIALYLQAETDIVNEIGRLRSLGLADYHKVAALERVQAILRRLEDDSWTYVPKMIEREFYVRHQEARRIDEPVSKHLAAYTVAQALTTEQTFVAEQLVMNLMGELTEANVTAMNSVREAVLGRAEPDIFRSIGLEQVMASLTRDPEHDLYRISSHDTGCALCAPYGRPPSWGGVD